MQKKIYNHALNPDENTMKQFEHCYSQDFVEAAALMPDAHSGYVAPIGAVLVTKRFIVPSWVGFDIGCGMIAVKFKGKNLVEKVKKKAEEIYREINREVPMGYGHTARKERITEKTKEDYSALLADFQKERYNKDVLNMLKNSAILHLGTLGGGNHFAELCSNKNELWLVIHSGSRGVGYKIAEKYMKIASNSEKQFEKTYPLDSSSEIGKEYLSVLNFCLDFALLNRLEMSYKILSALQRILKENIKAELWTNKNHNHAILEHGFYIHRKGATPAKKGERGVIPANMRDGSFLVEGKGNAKFLKSSSHGAGRALSRTEAKKVISMSEFQNSMAGITGTISQKTLDEAPMAYKNIYEVMEAQKDSVKIIKHLLPIINWKG